MTRDPQRLGHRRRADPEVRELDRSPLWPVAERIGGARGPGHPCQHKLVGLRRAAPRKSSWVHVAGIRVFRGARNRPLRAPSISGTIAARAGIRRRGHSYTRSQPSSRCHTKPASPSKRSDRESQSSVVGERRLHQDCGDDAPIGRGAGEVARREAAAARARPRLRRRHHGASARAPRGRGHGHRHRQESRRRPGTRARRRRGSRD